MSHAELVTLLVSAALAAFWGGVVAAVLGGLVWRVFAREPAREDREPAEAQDEVDLRRALCEAQRARECLVVSVAEHRETIASLRRDLVRLTKERDEALEETKRVERSKYAIVRSSMHATFTPATLEKMRAAVDRQRGL